MLSSNVNFVSVIILSVLVTQVNPCTLSSSVLALTSGEKYSLTCTADDGEYIAGFSRGNDVLSADTVFQPRTLNGDGTIRNPEFVADGYSVNNSNKQVIFTLNSANASQAGRYWCICSFEKGATKLTYTSSYIIIVNSGLYFVGNSRCAFGEPVQLTCSVEIAGLANSSINITDSDGRILNSSKTIESSGILQTRSLVHNVTKRHYFCDISLEHNGTTIFNRRLNTSVQFSVRNVLIIPDNPQVCHKDGYCKSNVRLSCIADGCPDPTYVWTIYSNTTSNFTTSNYSTSQIGPQVIQCTAFNTIEGVLYYVSENFSTNVTSDVYILSTTTIPAPAVEDNVPLIVGLVVGIVGGLLLISLVVLVIVILWKRKKRQAVKKDVDIYEKPDLGDPYSRQIGPTYQHLNRFAVNQTSRKCQEKQTDS